MAAAYLRTSPGDSSTTGEHRGRLTGLWFALAIDLGGSLLALGGASRVVELLLPLVAVAVGARLLAGRPAAYLELVLWLWLLTPFARRVVDLGTGYTSVSPVLLAPPLASLVALAPVLSRSRPVPPALRAYFAVSLPVLGYGTAVGVVENGAGPALVALLGWLAPLALGMWVAGRGPDDRELRDVVTRVAVWGSLVTGAYAVVQFLVLPRWDAFWMQNAGLNSIGNPAPLEVRVFSTLNSPGPYATTAAALLTVALGARSRGRMPALVAGGVGLALSLVRAAWGAFVLAALVLGLRSGSKVLSRVVLGLGVPLVVLSSVGGPLQKAVVSRFQSSTQAGTSDESFVDRVAFYGRTLPAVLSDVVGHGLGAVGTATKLSNAQGQLGKNGNFDSGLLEHLYTFGVAAGLLLLGLLIGVVVATWRAAARRDGYAQACAAGAAAIAVQLVFVNVLLSVTGALFWVLVGCVARARDDDAPAIAASTTAPLISSPTGGGAGRPPRA